MMIDVYSSKEFIETKTGIIHKAIKNRRRRSNNGDLKRVKLVREMMI